MQTSERQQFVIFLLHVRAEPFYGADITPTGDRAMSKAILVCVVLLSGLTSAVADQIRTPSGVARKADTSRKAAFDGACLDAIALVANNNYQTPLSARALANVMMCNGHPSQAICEISSRVMLQEYGKTPFTCGTNVADSVPLVFPADRSAP
jgi:hypothetical protein